MRIRSKGCQGCERLIGTYNKIFMTGVENMATIRSFRAYRPRPDVAGRVAALPYDVYNRQEAEIEVKREPLSFLKVDRAETSFWTRCGYICSMCI